MDFYNLKKLEQNDFFQTYNRLDIAIEKAEGCFLITANGSRILDMFGGLAVNVLGYGHKKMNYAIKEQVDKYIHISNLFYQEKQIELAEKIKALSGAKKLFFCNSGTEAVEAAIKLVRKYFTGTNKTELISFTGSFHGRTMGALSLTARKKYRDQFLPLLQKVKHLEFNSINDLESGITNNTAAVFIECIQGEGGINFANKEFISKLNELKQIYGFLIAADEIQSGVGRTGTFSAYTQFELETDIIIMAKGIGGGLPLGAIAGFERVENVFSYGEHGSTFGGNPVAAASGVVVMDELLSGLMISNIENGKLLFQKLSDLKKKYPELINNIRGMGLMIGIELALQGDKVTSELMNRGVLVNCTNENVIRLLPPYIITEFEIDLFIRVLDDVLMEI